MFWVKKWSKILLRRESFLKILIFKNLSLGVRGKKRSIADSQQTGDNSSPTKKHAKTGKNVSIESQGQCKLNKYTNPIKKCPLAEEFPQKQGSSQA